VVIAAVDGTTGVGKTALALHWAHRVKSRFPDGSLYADLHGYGPGQPADPSRVLDGFLAALDVAPTKIPPEADAKAALYRSLLDERHMLVVLDNAANPQQVRPLLPGSPGCLVLVTSRGTLTGLVARDRAQLIHLDVLPADDAVALLAEFIGADRVKAQPGPARRLALLCAHLPVALCAAGARAAIAATRDLEDLADELADQQRRLDLLDAGGFRLLG
jgi:predicted ATPase